MAYIRTKKIKGKEYQYKVEGYRDKEGKVKQRVLEYLGPVAQSEAENPMVTTPQKLSFEEYLSYDDGTNKRYELVAGNLVLMNPPSKRHFNITRFLLRLFESEILRQKLDYEVFAGIGVRTGIDSSRLPDVSVASSEDWRNLPDDVSAILQVPSLLAVEIVSPGNKQIERDYTEKVAEYQKTGIPEYWIVDPIAQKITVLVLVAGSYTKTVFTGDEAIISPTFPNLEVTAAKILSA